jgi:hypothetical protein
MSAARERGGSDEKTQQIPRRLRSASVGMTKREAEERSLGYASG